MRVRVLGMGTVTTGMSDTTEISGMRGMQEMQGRTGTVPVHRDETARATTRLELDPGRVAEIAGDASLRDALKGASRARVRRDGGALVRIRIGGEADVTGGQGERGGRVRGHFSFIFDDGTQRGYETRRPR